MINHETEVRPNGGSSRETGRISKSQFNFFGLASQLSEIKRQGWIDRGIEHPESVADHSFQVALMSIVEAERRGLDVQRVLKMALIHDLPEVYAGDITPYQHLPEQKKEEAILYRWIAPSEEALEEKRKKEEEALQRIVQGLPVESRASIVELWQEYSEGQTEEAKLVHRMDRIQRLLQAKRYWDQEGRSFPIGSFVQEALSSDDSEIRRLARGIQKDIS